MTYRRNKATRKLEGDERRRALRAYVDYYSAIAQKTPQLLNQKLPRSVVEKIHDEIGGLLQKEAKTLSKTSREIRCFLKKNPVPRCLGRELTDEIRCFALLLHSLNQWCVAEKLAMDRFLCSGDVRKEIRSLFEICPVAPGDGDRSKVELHHPLRDGRPPIPLSKKGHDIVEGLLVLKSDDTEGEKLVAFRKSNAPLSWKRLRIGGMLTAGHELEGFSKAYLNDCRRKIRHAVSETGLTEAQVLDFLDRYGLGLLEE